MNPAPADNFCAASEVNFASEYNKGDCPKHDNYGNSFKKDSWTQKEDLYAIGDATVRENPWKMIERYSEMWSADLRWIAAT